MTMHVYWVVGGIYKTTRFDEIADGQREERYGPFKSIDDARMKWQSLSWQNVDACHVRYQIVEHDDSLTSRAA